MIDRYRKNLTFTNTLTNVTIVGLYMKNTKDFEPFLVNALTGSNIPRFKLFEVI